MYLRRERQIKALCLTQLQYCLGLIEFLFREAQFAT